MGITVYEPAPTPVDENLRELAVVASGALTVRNDAALQSLVEEARQRLGTGMAAVSIVYKDWQYLIAASGATPGAYSRRASLCGHAIMDGGDIFYVADARADNRFADNPMLIDNAQLRFYAAAPLLGEEDMPLGTLCVFDREPRDALAPYDRMQLEKLAGAVMARLAELRPD